MTPFKNFSTESTWRRRLRRGGMYVAVAAMLGAQAGCSNDNGSDWEDVTVQEPTKGVVTTLEENENGEFDIVDERVVSNKEDARVIVRHRDGQVDSLTLAQARGLVQPQDTVAPQQSNGYRSHGMGHVLWWGAMGYMMGRSLGSPVQPYVYRSGANNVGGFMAGTGAAEELRRTSVGRTVRMPAKGRSGFFRGFRGSSGA